MTGRAADFRPDMTNALLTRRAAMRSAAGLGAGAVLSMGPAAAASTAFKELTWRVSLPGISAQPFRSRVVSGVPALVAYGKPVAIGPVIVQALCDVKVWSLAKSIAYDAFSGVVTTTVVVTDSRGLSGRFPVKIVFPRAAIPTGPGDYVLTGTATLSGDVPLPLPRNPGLTTIAVAGPATGTMVAYKSAAGTSTQFTSQMTLVAGQDPVVATIEVQ